MDDKIREEIGKCEMHQFTGPYPSQEEIKKAWDKYVEECDIEFNKWMNGTELCASHGRTILKTLDGKVIVTPEAPESIKSGNSYWILNKIGKERWNKGLDILDYRCFDIGIHANIVEKGLL